MAVCFESSADDVHHPGLLLHDSPREADLNLRIYQRLLDMADAQMREAQRNGEVPHQYIVTTTSLPSQRLQQQVPAAWHWHGRAVKIVDGSGVSMPDTEANQQEYPQPGSQAPGLGFPVARLGVVLSLACGAVLAAAVGRIKGQQTSETMLFHGLHTHLERDDVILADRFYCSYWEIALVRGPGE